MLVTSSWKIFLFRERGLRTVIAAIGTALTSRLFAITPLSICESWRPAYKRPELSRNGTCRP
jgi:hypothetical protein